MIHSLSKYLASATSALMFFAMSSLPAMAQQKTIAKSNTVSVLAADHGLSEAAQQYLLHYKSVSGVDGKTIRTDTASVFIPFGSTPQEGWPVVVWAHGTVGVANVCAPSLNVRSVRDKQYLNTWLSLGFAIVAPDYPGLGSSGLHHYLNARGEAWSILDGVRESLKEFPLKNEIILVGQSQGAHAAFSAAGYQQQYAPELNIRATILTGTPYFSKGAKASDILHSIDGKAVQGGDPKIPYLFYIFLSAADLHPELKASDYFQDKALPVLEQANHLCITALTEQVMEKELNAGNSLKPAVESLLETSIDAMIYPTLRIDHPVFIGMGSVDVNVPTMMQERFARAVKQAGTPVEVHVYQGLDHSGTVNPSLRNSVPFVTNVLKEKHHHIN